MSANLLKLNSNDSEGIYRERPFKVNAEEQERIFGCCLFIK